jgi:hypothetical protein
VPSISRSKTRFSETAGPKRAQRPDSVRQLALKRLAESGLPQLVRTRFSETGHWHEPGSHTTIRMCPSRYAARSRTPSAAELCESCAQRARSARASTCRQRPSSFPALIAARTPLAAQPRDHERLRDLREREGTDTGPVFATKDGNELDAANVRREFRAAVKAAGFVPGRKSPGRDAGSRLRFAWRWHSARQISCRRGSWQQRSDSWCRRPICARSRRWPAP